MARLMGLDLGEKRIGVAITDVQQTVAFPERVLVRRSAKADRQAIVALVHDLQVDCLVIGLPLSMAGDFGPNAERAKNFGQYIGRAIRIPVVYQDERLTTVEAEERLRDSGLPAAERRRRIDAAAAAIILEDYMRSNPA